MRYLTLAVIMLSLTITASADTYQTFALVGAADTSANPLTGTLTIDITNGTVTGANVSYLAQSYTFILTQFPQDNPNPISYEVWVGTSPANLPSLHFGVPGSPVLDSLIGYVGGLLCSSDSPCGPDGNGTYWATGLHDAFGGVVALQSGELAPVPEPSALLLLGSGMIGIAGAIRRRLLS